LQTGTTTKGTRDLTEDEVGGGVNALHLIGKATYSKRGRSDGALADICDTIVWRPDRRNYLYQDCLLILTASGQVFSEDADSGAAVYDNLRRVVGINFAGAPTEYQAAQIGANETAAMNSGCINVTNLEVTNAFKKPGSWACQIKHVISQFNADTGMTLSIPDTDAETVLTAAGETEAAATENALSSKQVAALVTARRRFRETEVGRETYALIKSHQYEVRRLIRTNPKVATAWHRIGGPSIAFMILDAAEKPNRPLPADFGGYSMREGLRTFGSRLSRFGSPGLRRDLESILPLLESVPGSSLDALFANLEARTASSDRSSPKGE
jgi:hypothetical protein